MATSAVLEVSLLGPVEARRGGTPLALGGKRQRVLLAALALEPGQVVPASRLVEALWGEAPPGTAVTALHGHISGLRKVLGHEDGPLMTRPPGYLLDAAAVEVDVGRFEALVESGRQQLARGDPQRAAADLREALALWRGPALADLRDEPLAAQTAGRLDDLRIQALEDRVEADLALGGAEDLLPDLQAAVRAEPLRERLRGQLMLALYRSGRHAEALAVYAAGRRLLAEELGLAPGRALQQLEREILEHAPSLERPRTGRVEAPAAPEPQSAPPGRRRTAVLAAAAAAAAAVVLAVVLVSGGGERGPPADSRAGPGLATIPHGVGRATGFVATGGTPAAVAVGEGAAWMVDADGQTLRHVDPATGRATTFAIGATPIDVVAGAGAVWVGRGGPVGDVQAIGPAMSSIARVDPATRTVRARIRLPRTGPARQGKIISHLAVHGDDLWAISPDLTVARIDTRTNRVRGVARRVRARAVAAGAEGVWVLESRAVVRIDPRTGRVVQRVRLPATELSGLAVGAGAVWATSRGDGTLWRVDPAGRPASRTIEVGTGAGAVVVGRGSVWVVNGVRGTVVQVDPRSNRVFRTVLLHGTPREVALGEDRAWVAVAGDAAAAATAPAPAGGRSLPASACGPILTGGGRPDVLIVSDLALQGGIRIPVQQMVDAIALTLRRHAFRAGRLHVGYQSCDDSVARTGLFDVDKCIANAKAYAAAPAVIGVIGTVNSPCTLAEVPILNRAPRGPLAMVSPASSYLGLTRAGPGTAAGEPDRLYPTGRRSFARVAPTDDRAVAALALQAEHLGLRRVVLLDDGEPTYSRPLAAFFRRAARRVGVPIVGALQWDGRSPDQRALARRVAGRRPDGVVLIGVIDANGGPLVRDLRAELGPGPALLANDGFTPIPLLFDLAGGAARGVYVSLPGVPASELGAAGRRFAAALRATQPGVDIAPSAISAAQATEALLQAIARSDGTRASVTRELFRVRGEGPGGPLGFDANGDVIAPRIMILRARRRTLESRPGEFEGGAIERVVAPPAALTAERGG